MDDIFTLSQIGEWVNAKRKTLATSTISITGIHERPEFLPAMFAEFSGDDVMGRITGWVSGEFDFEIVRVSDGTDRFWRHITVANLEELEATYEEFLEHLMPEA